MKVAAWSAFFVSFLFSSFLWAQQIVDVIINVPPSTPSQQGIFLTGDAPELCHWRPDCVRLRPISQGTFGVRLSFTGRSGLSFKVTRGSYKTEASDPFNRPLPNFFVPISKNHTEFVYTVINWVDTRPLGVTGQVKVFHNVASPQLNNFRNISVWLPPDYGFDSAKKYSVIYMSDGQNVFDPKTSSFSVDWQVDEAMTAMTAQHLVPGAIVVGIDSTADRFQEYDYTLKGRLYARFLIDTVKPMIDGTFRTLPDRDHSFVMGSSMGAHISVALVWNHSDVFSEAGALSLPVFVHNNSLYQIVDNARPKFPIKIYMDHGNRNGDDDYEIFCRPFYQHLLQLGFPSRNLFYRIYGFAGHHEEDWARRVNIPLKWMLAGITP